MPRIVGIDIPKEKRIDVSLTYIFGVGCHTANKVLKKAGIDPATTSKDLTDDQVSVIANILQAEVRYEGNLRRELGIDIKRLMDIDSWRGMRHKKGLPVRGQRTRTNARGRKGPKKTIGSVKAKKPAAPAKPGAPAA